MARLFIALEIPERVRNRLEEEVKRLSLARADVAWTRGANYHITLRFLGETNDRALPELVALLKDAVKRAPPLDLEPCGLGRFPDDGDPHVVWAGIRGTDETAHTHLLEVRRFLNDGARASGFRAEKGKFVPHITLGRVRSPEGTAQLLDRMGPARIRPFGRFLAREAVLFESREGEFGTEYTPLARATFSGRNRA